MTLEALLICALAGWRVAHMLVNERGILGIGERIRRLTGVQTVNVERTVGTQTYTTSECTGNNEIARMLCCLWCTSVWTALLALLLWIVGTGITLSWGEAIVDWFAVATLSLVCEKVNRYV